MNITSFFDEVKADDSEVVREVVGDVVWGSWKEDESPHVCGFCKPVLEDYLVPVTTSCAVNKWKNGIVCFTCGWVPGLDPSRTRLIPSSVLFHSAARRREGGRAH
jgi:hypothetical protein